jgi:ribosomal protein S27E
MVIHLTHAVTPPTALERVCPKCHRAQVVPLSKKTDTVPCEVCSTSIPPIVQKSR